MYVLGDIACLLLDQVGEPRLYFFPSSESESLSSKLSKMARKDTSVHAGKENELQSFSLWSVLFCASE